ncbi:MAG: YIP1 family protein [Acidobacteriaceae bacterium]|nr:YIP1 family protein [Acidobacteriaceae bacterium]
MSTTVSGVPANRPESLADDIAGMGSFFIDPANAARRIFHKWFWLGPLVVVSVIAAITIYLRMPLTQHVLEVTPPRGNMSPEQYQRTIDISMMMQRIFMYLSPVLTGILIAVQALILLGMCSVLTVGAKFRSLFNLVAGCSLIQSLAAIASVVILRAKGEASTMAELNPPLGLDIFLSEGTNKYVMGFLGFFSLFQIWWAVMMVLILSAAFRISKGKAFIIVLPLLLLGLIFRLVGAMFQGG